MTGAEKSLQLLRKAAEQFRFYEASHKAKVPTADTLEKARVNGELAAELEAHIAFLEEDAA